MKLKECLKAEKLAGIIRQYHIGCNLPIECYTKCDECCAKAILEAGYLQVVPVQLEVLGDEELQRLAVGCIDYPKDADGEYDWANPIITKGCIDKKWREISQATITHNETKFGKLYRR